MCWTRVIAGGPVRGWYAAAGDCEQVRSGLIGQPANTVSAVGYLVAGGWLLARVGGRPEVPRRYRWFAAVIAANGVGSGLYHGPAWPGSRWCHDAAALAVPVFVAVDGLGAMWGWAERRISRAELLAIAVAALAVLAPPMTNPGMLTAVTAAVLTETAVTRRPAPPARVAPDAARPGGLPGGPPGRPGLIVAVTALALGLSAYLLGRTGGPLCRPGSLLQPHALWHLLTAVAMAGWASDRIHHRAH